MAQSDIEAPPSPNSGNYFISQLFWTNVLARMVGGKTPVSDLAVSLNRFWRCGAMQRKVTGCLLEFRKTMRRRRSENTSTIMHGWPKDWVNGQPFANGEAAAMQLNSPS